MRGANTVCLWKPILKFLHIATAWLSLASENQLLLLVDVTDFPIGTTLKAAGAQPAAFYLFIRQTSIKEW